MIRVIFMSSQYLKRLSLIDFYLTYVGSFQRNDLMNHFDIGSVTATRDIKEYRQLYPENIIYDVSSKSYVKNNTTFKKNFVCVSANSSSCGCPVACANNWFPLEVTVIVKSVFSSYSPS